MQVQHADAAGRRLIEGFEGFVPRAYRDQSGVLTIGYGHTSGAGGYQVRPGATITRAEADAILGHDLLVFEPDVRAGAGKTLLTQGQFDACLSLAYNLGGPRFRRSAVAACLQAGDVSGAAHAFMQYVTAGGRYNQGLANRRHAEALVFAGHGTPHAVTTLVALHDAQGHAKMAPDVARG